MSEITEEKIANIVKKHFGFTLFLAVVPVVFFLLMGFFEKEVFRIALFVLPISTIGAVAYYMKRVLTDLYANDGAE